MSYEKSALIITGGKLDIEFAKEYTNCHTFDCYIAVDNGLSSMEQLLLSPDVLVGDFDTVRPELVLKYKSNNNITIVELNPEKDETDTESAIDYIIQRGYNKVVLLGALGGRFDHTLSNLHMLYRLLQHNIKGNLVDEHNCIYLIDRPHTIEKKKLYGTYISLLPFTSEVNNLSLHGFKYPLNHACLNVGTSLGISNEAVDSECSITFCEGVLIVIEAHD